MAGRSTCNAIVDCVVRILKGKHGNLERECGTDILEGLVKDVEKKMSDWTNTLAGVASLANDATTSFLETVGCGKDPSSGMTDSISAIGKIFEGLTNYPAQLEKSFEILPEFLSLKPTDFYTLLGTDDEKEKDYFSFLLGPSIGIQLGPVTLSKNFGVFVTVPIEVLTTCAHSYFDRSKLGDCLKKMDIYEIGIYEAIGTGLTSSFGASVDLAGGMEFLHGTSNKWGGYGFGISIGTEAKVLIAKAGGSVGLVFSALDSGGKIYMDELIGFNVYINAGVGPEDPTPVSVSIGCAFAKVSTPDKCKKPEPPKCPNQKLKQMVNKLKKTAEQMGQDWLDLYNTCKSYWGKKWKKCSNAADNYADSYKGCGKGFTRKCASFKSDYCQPGKWKAATKTCKKYYEKKGNCKAWNTKKYCSNYGQKRGSCEKWNTRKYCSNYGQKQGSCKSWNTRTYCSNYGQKRGSCSSWNTRRYCSNYGQKKGSCRTWNTRSYCGQYGQKNQCDWVRKGTNWARIPYPCGVRWCKKGWIRYPCGAKICHKNVAKALMGWSCKLVTDLSRCVRHVVQNLSCRTWNYVKDTSRCLRHVVQNTSCRTYNFVKDTSNCLKHVVENTSCRSYNFVKDTSNCLKHVVENTSCKSWKLVKDTSNCLKHVVENTSCQAWDYVKDTTKCIGGWLHTAGKCTVDTVGHCSKWAGACTKSQVMSKIDMFKDCGVNMLPYAPV